MIQAFKSLFGKQFVLAQKTVVLLVLPLLGAELGCGGSKVDVPATFPVKGTVRVKGKPAKGVRVVLHSQQETKGAQYLPIGETGPNGTFELSTGAPLNGAPPGNYTVTFEKPVIDPKQSVETEIDAFQGKYSDPKASKYQVQIDRGDNQLPPFDLD